MAKTKKITSLKNLLDATVAGITLKAAAKTAPTPKPVKLSGTAARMLALGAGNTTDPRVVPAADYGKGTGKIVNSLLNRALVVKLRADHTQFVVEREGQTAYSIQVTNLGFAAVNLEPTEADGPDPVAAFAKAGCMPKSYHDLYMAQGGGCADTIDKAMKDAFLTGSRTITTKGKDGKSQIRSEAALDLEAMEVWGREIGLWNDKWASLNPGMKRMNLTNRVRAAVRRGVEIKLTAKQGNAKGKSVTLTVPAKA